MNILIIPSWYPNETDEVTGSFFKEQASALVRKGHNVIVLNATFQNRINAFNSNNFHLTFRVDNGIKTYSYTMPSFGLWRMPRVGSFVFQRNIYKMFQKVLSDGEKVDIIHAHSFFPGGISAGWLGKKYNLPVVLTEHSSGLLLNNLKKGQIYLLRKTIEDVNAVIAVSARLAEAIKKYNNKKVIVIPNMVNEKFFYFKEKESTSKEPFKFITVARLDKNKRIDMVIKAFSLFCKKIPNSILVILGDGSEKKSLMSLRDSFDLKDKIFFLGQCAREKVAEEMKNSDAFVLASAAETFGLVYIEALACGIPIILPKAISENFILPSEGVTIIGEESVEGLQQAMYQTYHDYCNYDKEKIAKECYNIYSYENVILQLEKLYEEVVDSYKRVNLE